MWLRCVVRRKFTQGYAWTRIAAIASTDRTTNWVSPISVTLVMSTAEGQSSATSEAGPLAVNELLAGVDHASKLGIPSLKWMWTPAARTRWVGKF